MSSNGFTAADMSTAAENGFRDGLAAQPAAAQEVVEDRLLVALERAVFAEAALRELADECENDNASGWEGRMQACLLHARQVLKHAPVAAAPDKSLGPLSRIADAFGVTGTWEQIADAVISRSTPAAPGIDVSGQAFRCIQKLLHWVDDNAETTEASGFFLIEAEAETVMAALESGKAFGTSVDNHGSKLRVAARDFYNATYADPTVRIRCSLPGQKDRVTTLAEALREALIDASPKGDVPLDDLVPGVMRCAKCSFQLHRTNLYLHSGTTGPGDSKTEPCPNGCGPLWPVTWQTWATEGWQQAERYHEELRQLQDSTKGDTDAPMQPVITDGKGVLRFKANALVRALLDHGDATGLGLNELARQEHSAEDRMQLAQLIGYSVFGYATLSYVTDSSYDAAMADASPKGGSTDANKQRVKWLEVRGLAAGIVENLKSFAEAKPKDWCGALDDSLDFADLIEKEANKQATSAEVGVSNG